MMNVLTRGYVFFLIISTLSCISLFFLCGMDRTVKEFEWGNLLTYRNHKFFLQSQWVIIALAATLIIRYVIGISWLTNYAYVWYIVMLLVLAFTAIFSENVRGSHSWLSLFGIIKVQPAEFSKITTTLFIAQYISIWHNLKKWKTQFAVFIIALIPSLLIVAQREVGQSLFFIALIIPLSRAGAPVQYFYILLLFFCLSILVLIVDLEYLNVFFFIAFCFFAFYHTIYRARLQYKLPYYIKVLLIGTSLFFTYHQLVPYAVNHLLEPHHIRRVYSIVDIGNKQRDWMTPGTKTILAKTNFKSIKYNVRQAEIAIGSGGFLGKGMKQSTQMQLDFIPEQHTDFIFSAIAESWGLIGCLFVMLLYLLLLLGLLFLAEQQKSIYARTVIYCVFAYLLFNITVNIGMVIGIFPVVGIPLPWLSYGGSSFIVNSLMVAMAYIIHRTHKNQTAQ